MGADLIGYQTMYPSKFDDKEKKILKEYLDKVKALLNTPNLANILTKEKIATDPYYKLLLESASYINYEIEDRGYHDSEEEIQELIDEVIGCLEGAYNFIENTEIEERDVSSRTYTFGGIEYTSIFAGEASWGDEPDGYGYETLRSLDRVGLLYVIENNFLPTNNPLSKRFITEE